MKTVLSPVCTPYEALDLGSPVSLPNTQMEILRAGWSASAANYRWPDPGPARGSRHTPHGSVDCCSSRMSTYEYCVPPASQAENNVG